MLKKIIFLIILFIIFSAPAYPSQNNSIKFFASNNTNILDIPTAYQRLTGMAQLELKKSLIAVLQKDHVEQGRLIDVLGTYEMTSDNKVTADNSEIFFSSPLQFLNNEDAFKIAQDLAIALKQESVAVFIPNDQEKIGNIEVVFTQQKPYIQPLITRINDSLPTLYHQAFSLRLNTKGLNLDKPKVNRVEWLGSAVKLSEIQKEFSNNKVIFHHGSAYLVYNNGSIQHL